MPKLPDLGPMLCGDAVCSQCGRIMEKRFVQNARGHVLQVVYTCLNEEIGCAYEVMSDHRLPGMQRMVS